MFEIDKSREKFLTSSLVLNNTNGRPLTSLWISICDNNNYVTLENAFINNSLAEKLPVNSYSLNLSSSFENIFSKDLFLSFNKFDTSEICSISIPINILEFIDY